MTFADGVLKLVRAGARIELRADSPVRATWPVVPQAAQAEESDDMDEVAGAALLVAHEPQMAEPGLGDLEAAVALVESGLATRIVLAGFPSWPGLLWRAYQLADEADVAILPTVVRPGGLVDIVITRATAADV